MPSLIKKEHLATGMPLIQKEGETTTGLFYVTDVSHTKITCTDISTMIVAVFDMSAVLENKNFILEDEEEFKKTFAALQNDIHSELVDIATSLKALNRPSSNFIEQENQMQGLKKQKEAKDALMSFLRTTVKNAFTLYFHRQRFTR